MPGHKVRQMMKAERDLAEKRFRREKNKNLLSTPGIHQCMIVLDHLKPTFNIGKIFRSADVFSVHQVHLVGIDFFDPAPGMGAFKWVPAMFHRDFFQCYTYLVNQGYTPFVLEPDKGEMICDIQLPERSAFIFGHEEFGLSFDPSLYPDIRPLTIPQYGRTESLNVSIAASITMYEYARQHNRCQNGGFSPK